MHETVNTAASEEKEGREDQLLVPGRLIWVGMWRDIWINHRIVHEMHFYCPSSHLLGMCGVYLPGPLFSNYMNPSENGLGMDGLYCLEQWSESSRDVICLG